MVSCCEGQVTFLSSTRTSFKKIAMRVKKFIELAY
jgi:hypothetical protein